MFQSHLLSPTCPRPRASCFYLDRLSPRRAERSGACVWVPQSSAGLLPRTWALWGFHAHPDVLLGLPGSRAANLDSPGVCVFPGSSEMRPLSPWKLCPGCFLPGTPLHPSVCPSVRLHEAPWSLWTPARRLLAHSLQACPLPAFAAHSIPCSSPAWTPDPCGGDTPILPAHTAPSAMTSAAPWPWSHLLAALFGAEGTPRARSDLCAPRPQSWRAPRLSGVAFASDECQRCPASRTSTAWGAPPLLTPPIRGRGVPMGARVGSGHLFTGSATSNKLLKA